MVLPIPEVAESASSLSGVASGGGAGFGAFWLARFLFKQDKEAIRDLATTVKELTVTITELRLEVARLGVHVENAQKSTERVNLIDAQVGKLTKDVGVAHRRIELIAAGKPIQRGNANGQ